MVRVESCREAASIMGAKMELKRIRSQAADKQRIQKVIGKHYIIFFFNFFQFKSNICMYTTANSSFLFYFR